MTCVLVVDDHPTTRRGIRRLIDREPDLDVVAEAGNADEALRFAQQRTPDVVVLDLSLPDRAGPEIIGDLRALGARIVVFSAHAGRGFVDAVFKTGAEGYVVKDQPERDLVDAVRAVAAGRARWGVAPNAPETVTTALTDRETDVLHLLARGLSNEHIGDMLSISEGTVRNVLSKTYQKIGVTTSREALVWAREQGIGYTSDPPAV